ncbi:CERS1 synthase, partial [Amia calva]|nr:CERS1 synthase [Amia calva]
MPGYAELVLKGYATMLSAYQDCSSCGWELSKRTLLDNASLTRAEVALFLLCALGWTVLRQVLSACLFRPFGQWCRLLPKDVAKMPESAWKLLFYTMSWSYSSYLLFFTQYSFFQDPPSVFYDWKRGMEVPTDIAIAYLIQGSFYAHSLYATVYMDAWRKDSVIMVVHHIVTLALIIFSYAFRYHSIGVLVLFLHDVNDIQLEFMKVNVYFRNRGGVYHVFNDIISNMVCVSFSISWFWFRLYWFPLKVLNASCISSLQSVPNIPFYFFFNSLLFALTLMNIYWFLYIMLFVVKVLTGQMREVNDVREYDLEDSKRAPMHGKPVEPTHYNSWKDR